MICQQQTINGDSVTLTGKAVFEYRTPSSQGLSTIKGSKNIRHASIDVLSQQECTTAGQTDSQGNFSIEVPYKNQEEIYH